jgi:hypothetical protein
MLSEKGQLYKYARTFMYASPNQVTAQIVRPRILG